MTAMLDVRGLTKRYPSFLLDEVSLSVFAGEIVGFIGRNGAGKSTSLKSIMGMVHPDGGEICFFGTPRLSADKIKQRVGFVDGGISHYLKTRIGTITAVTRRFYDTWDEDVYKKLIADFSLDETKTPSELSAGMKVKYSVALALSHGAELLILDEPTSGLDPMSRDELLDIFLTLREQGKGILFSTHIISDLERCADRIVYIRQGQIFANMTPGELTEAYRKVVFSQMPDDEIARRMIGIRRERDGASALIRAEDAVSLESSAASLEEIMLYIERDDSTSTERKLS